MNMDKEEVKRETVCVTGAAGFIGSCLVKNLLQKGYVVHATLRDPENPAKNSHLLSLPGATERLHLFKADLLQHGSFDSAIKGCDSVINLATSTDFQGDVVNNTVDGTMDILRSCKKAKTVKRVIHTSSMAAAYPLNEDGQFKEVLDESCWTPVDYIKHKDDFSGIYALSKTLAEQAALRYGEEEEIEVVTVVLGMVGGPSLTPTIPGSVSTMLAPLSGNGLLYEILVSSKSMLGSAPLVHVEDVCSAHIYLMEHPSAAGRYVCCSDPVTVADMLNFFRKRYPEIPLAFGTEEVEDESNKVFVPISSKKLIDLGFSYKYDIEGILSDTIAFAKQMKVL
ncbi:putative anthocyanidin reductase [Cryptomeria japonica]|uniref:putative anthocyanidin reductase n=1 Tax=Cryptomeria japonica TaxID=3369 RepID=UPI0027DA4F65|nr:putative anthocyanidin reductase [Cryptomeria japonica]